VNIIRAQSLLLAFGALLLPHVNFRCTAEKGSRCRVQTFRLTASNTWSSYSKKEYLMLRLQVAIWAYSSSIEHNENNKRIRIFHTRVKLRY